MNIGYHDNFWGKSPEMMFEMADWENAQFEMINRDFQAAMPHLIAQAQVSLDDEEFASMTEADYREWFWENAKEHTTASREMLDLWIAN